MGKLKLKYGLWEDYEDELQHDDETLYFITDKHEIYKGGVRYAIGHQSNTQVDWNQTDSTAADFIKNKPIINGECKLHEEGMFPLDITGLDDITEPGTYIFNCQSMIVSDDTENDWGNNSIILQVIEDTDTLTGDVFIKQVLYGLPVILMHLFILMQECLESEIYLGVLLTRDLNDQTWNNWEINRCTNDIIDYKLNDFATNTLALVATSGSYNDLSDIPEITQSDWTETHADSPAYILHKPQLSTVATSGNYNDLSNIPDLTLKEDKSNKSTEVIYNGTVSNNFYPTTKAVYDFVKSYNFIEGDITITVNSSGKKEYAFSNLDNVTKPGQYVYIGTYTYTTSDNITEKDTYPFLLGVSNNYQNRPYQRLTVLSNHDPITGLDIKRLSYFSRQLLGANWGPWLNYTIHASDIDDLATVATSGSYNDLSNTPMIPTKTSELTNDGSDGTDTYVESGDLATVATSGSYNDLSHKPTIGDGELTLQRNGTPLDTFSANASVNKTINITVPTQASDINALPDSTKYGSTINVSIDDAYTPVENPTGNPSEQKWYERSGTAPNYIYNLTSDTTVQSGKTYYTGPTYVVTTALKDQDGNTLGTVQTIDLPLESVVVSGRYDNTTKKVILTLQNGSTVEFSVADLVSGLQSEITTNNKLSADLVDDTNATNKFANNALITLTQDGVTKGTFRLNQSSDATINFDNGGVVLVKLTADYTTDPVTWTSDTQFDDIIAAYLSGKLPIVDTGGSAFAYPMYTYDLTGNSAMMKFTAELGPVNEKTVWFRKVSGQDQISVSDFNQIIGDGTITITQGGVNKGHFSVNQNSNTTIALDAGGGTSVQSDWNQTDSTADDYIKNKPIIPSKTSELTNDSGFVDSSSLATVATSGDYEDLINTPMIPTNTSDLTNDGSDGTDTYVESGDLATVAISGSYNDLINTPTIPAAQVNSDWNASSGVAQILNKPTTIAGYGITDAYTKTEVDTLVASAYKFAGTVSTVSGMGALTAANIGNVYNFDTSFTTTSDFVEGVGVTYPAGTNVVIAEISTGVYKYDVLSGFVDISGKQDIISGGTTNYGTTSINNNVLTLSDAPVRKGSVTGSAIIGNAAETNSGSDSLVVGQNNSNTATAAVVEGSSNIASAWAGHTEGYNNTNAGTQSHVEGSSNQLLDNSAYSHVENYNNVVYSDTAHVEGRDHIISKEVASQTEGEDPTVSKTTGFANHVEGYQNTIKETAVDAGISVNHIEGYNNKIENTYAAFNHIEGEGNEAINSRNHVEGYNNISSGGEGAHVEGLGCRARGNTQHVQGKYNVEDWNGDYAHIVGNGTENERSNAQTVTWTGTEWLATDVTCGGTNTNPAHQLSHKITEAPTDGRKYVRQSLSWQAVDGLLEYKGVVASADNLPGNPLRISYGSGDSAVEYRAVFQFNNITGKCTGMTLSVHPDGNNNSAWFRNGENILRAGGSVLSLNGYLLEYNVDFTTTPNNNGPWGQGITSIQYSFNVDVYENDVLTFSCNTWATENNGNCYKITDTNYIVTKPDAQIGEIYFIQDEMEVYMYDGHQWFSFAPNDIYQLDVNHLTLVNGYHNYFSTYAAGILQVTIPDTLADGKYIIDCPTFNAGAAYPPAINLTSNSKTITIVSNYNAVTATTGYQITVYVSGTNVYLYFNKN